MSKGPVRGTAILRAILVTGSPLTRLLARPTARLLRVARLFAMLIEVSLAAPLEVLLEVLLEVPPEVLLP